MNNEIYIYDGTPIPDDRRDTITQIEIDIRKNNLTEIANEAFQNCFNMIKISIHSRKC